MGKMTLGLDDRSARLIHGRDVWPQIKDLLSGYSNIQAAIAFVGAEADQYLALRGPATIVVNAGDEALRDGSTNPEVLLRWTRRGVRVYSLRTLHAKVILAEGNPSFVLVGSADVLSASGRQRDEAVLVADERETVDELRDVVTDWRRRAGEPLTEAWLQAAASRYRPAAPHRLVAPLRPAAPERVAAAPERVAAPVRLPSPASTAAPATTLASAPHHPVAPPAASAPSAVPERVMPVARTFTPERVTAPEPARPQPPSPAPPADGRAGVTGLPSPAQSPSGSQPPPTRPPAASSPPPPAQQPAVPHPSPSHPSSQGQAQPPSQPQPAPVSDHAPVAAPVGDGGAVADVPPTVEVGENRVPDPEPEPVEAVPWPRPKYIYLATLTRDGRASEPALERLEQLRAEFRVPNGGAREPVLDVEMFWWDEPARSSGRPSANYREGWHVVPISVPVSGRPAVLSAVHSPGRVLHSFTEYVGGPARTYYYLLQHSAGPSTTFRKLREALIAVGEKPSYDHAYMMQHKVAAILDLWPQIEYTD